MHRLDIALISVAASLVVLAVAVALGLYFGRRLRRRLFAGPVLDRWEEARSQLGAADRLRVWWATTRRRPVRRPALAPAQLALSALSKLIAERSPLLHQWWLRIGLPALYGLSAAIGILNAVTVGGQQGIVLGMAAGVMAVTALLWVIAVPRSLRRQPARMDELQARIRQRYDAPAA